MSLVIPRHNYDAASLIYNSGLNTISLKRPLFVKGVDLMVT